MKKISFTFSGERTVFYLDHRFSYLKKIVSPASAVIVTDENIFRHHGKLFRNWNTIVLKPGEQFKVQATVDEVINLLIEMKADRETVLVGVGGGVITDITGYVASVFMRGIRFGFVPSTLLAMVDASIGGKNGIDVGVYKNMAGTIRQPAFILHDLSILKSMPKLEWINGFAEIIKHACILNVDLFNVLEKNEPGDFIKDQSRLSKLVEQNVRLKSGIVLKDPFEKGLRRVLNFGHTLGHAIENQYELSHGQAISIGMTYACHLSADVVGFKNTTRVVNLLSRYGLPTYAKFDLDKTMEVLVMDKKRSGSSINYVLISSIGKAVVKPVKPARIKNIIRKIK